MFSPYFSAGFVDITIYNWQNRYRFTICTDEDDIPFTIIKKGSDGVDVIS